MRKLIICGALLILLTGCAQEPIATDVENNSSAVIINSGDKETYNTVAPMVQSPSRGVSNDYASDNLDLENMEVGLMNISKEFASPTEFLYQAGQVLSYEDAQMLLGRELTDEQYKKKLKSDEDYLNIGINPALNDGASEEDAKIYATSIIEQDYYTLDSDGNKVIDTIAIGFGINPHYEYQDGKETKTMDISDQELEEFGYSYIANNMTEYIRSLEGYENVQIVYGFFKQSETATIPGTYSAYTSVSYGASTLNSIETLNEDIVIFPSTSGEEKDSNLNSAFSSIEASVYDYFPTASGMYTYGYYSNDQLYDLNVYVMADIYSSVEVEPFVQYLEIELNNLITTTVPITVQVMRSNGDPLAIIYKEDGDTYNHHIY